MDSANRDTHAKKPAEDLVATVKSEGQRMVVGVKEIATKEVNARKEDAADFVKALASALDKGAGELKDQGRGTTGEMVESAANSLTEFATSIAKRPPSALLSDVETFARERPVLFFGATFALGFGIARFLMSTHVADARDPEWHPHVAKMPGVSR